jgi:hypothetical protein
VPPIFTAILLVTVFVVEDDTAVLAITVPVLAGKVSVLVPETSGALIVIAPDVLPLTTILAII